MPFTAPFRVGLNVPFEEAIRQAQRRGVVLPVTYYGVLQGVARSASFSIAGVTALDQLINVRDSLADAIRDGTSFEDWKTRVTSEEIDLKLPNYRLENIFRTNIQTSYMRGALGTPAAPRGHPPVPHVRRHQRRPHARHARSHGWPRRPHRRSDLAHVVSAQRLQLPVHHHFAHARRGGKAHEPAHHRIPSA
jgi:hypothetical protein